MDDGVDDRDGVGEAFGETAGEADGDPLGDADGVSAVGEDVSKAVGGDGDAISEALTLAFSLLSAVF